MEAQNKESNKSTKLLTGTIPIEIGALTNLQYLDMSFNKFSQYMPREIGNLKGLQSLYLSNNKLCGKILFHALTFLTFVLGWLIWCNLLTGNIPNAIGALTNLQNLDVWTTLVAMFQKKLEIWKCLSGWMFVPTS